VKWSINVADPGCLSRIPKQQQKRGGILSYLSTFFVATNITKLKVKNTWDNLQRIIELLLANKFKKGGQDGGHSQR
jgi:hypothetical protein